MPIPYSFTKRTGIVSRLHLLALSVLPSAVTGRLGAVLLVLACVFGSLAPYPLQAQDVTLVPIIITVAGNGSSNYSGDNIAATNAAISPAGVAVDRAGNVYIADFSNNRVRKVRAGSITTVAGNGTAGYSGDNGPATSAELWGPEGLAVDSAGNIYIATEDGHIRRVDAKTGIITTVAGGGSGCTGQWNSLGDNCPATSAHLLVPTSMAFDGAGNLLIADTQDNRIRKVSTNGIITTIAGNGSCTTKDNYGNCYSGDNGPATSAELSYPNALALDGAGNLYIADSGNNRIRQVNVNGRIFTVAGTGHAGSMEGGAPVYTDVDNPSGVAVDGAGNLYIADSGNNRIRKVNVNVGMITVAGTGYGAPYSGGYSGDNGPATSAEMWYPSRMTVDSVGSLYVVDNLRIRKLPSVSPVDFGEVNAGSSSTQSVVLSINTAVQLYALTAAGDFSVQSNSCALNTSFPANTNCTLQVRFAPTKPGERWAPLIVMDSNSNTYSFGLRGTGVGPALAFTPGTITTVVGNGTKGYGGDNGPATSAQISAGRIALGGAGNMYLAEPYNYRIRRVTANGVISTVAGNGTRGFSGDNGPATSAQLDTPDGVTVDSGGNLYIADTNNNRIRKVSLGGIITTIAGNGTHGYSGDNGPATSAQLWNPSALVVDDLGNLYITDSGNNVIRKVDTNGIITTVAGYVSDFLDYECSNGISNVGDNGPAISAALCDPSGITLDGAGNLYIADLLNRRIRKVDTNGIITTVAGNGTAGYNWDDIPAISAELYNPTGVAVDSAGNLYIADYANNRVRKVDTNGFISTVAGNGFGSPSSGGFTGDNGPATNAELYGPGDVKVDGAGNLYISDAGNYRIRKVDVSTSALSFSPLGVGWTSDPQSVAVSNAGNAALNFSGISATENFKLQTVGNDCTSGTPLEPGEGCTLAVVFAPSVANVNWGQVIVTDDANTSPQVINLYGATADTKVLQTITVSPATAWVGIGFTQQFTAIGHYSDNSTQDLTSSAAWSSSAPTKATFGPAGLATGLAVGSTTITATINTMLGVVTSDPGALLQVIPLATLITSGPMDFGMVNVGSTSTQSVSFTVTTPLTLANVQASGEFTVVTNSCDQSMNTTQLSANTTCTLQVSFTPIRPGHRSAPLVVTDSSSKTYSFSLEGTGVGSLLAFTPGIITTVAGNGKQCVFDPTTCGDGGPATSASFFTADNLAVDAVGNLYITDWASGVIRKVDTGGVITTFAGDYTKRDTYSGDNGPATSAGLYDPRGLAVDGAGNVYIADAGNARVRKVDANGIITTVAGNGTPGYSGDKGLATNAKLTSPGALALDKAGNLYISAYGSVRKVDPSGIITTVAGNGIEGYDGDNGLAVGAELYGPSGLAIDGAGNLYIADANNNRVRKVDINGIITTFAGNGTYGYSGDNGPATSAELEAGSLAMDGAGNLYISGGNRVRKVDPSGIITTVAGGGSGCAMQSDSWGDNCPATSVALSYAFDLALDGNGNLYIAAISLVRKVDVTTSALNFGTVTIGYGSGTQSVTATNIGNSTLKFTSIIGSPNFGLKIVGNDCVPGTPLGVGAGCSVGAYFFPSPSVGNSPVTGAITMTDDAVNSPQSVVLSGIAIMPQVATATALNLGAVTVVNGQTVPITATVTTSAFNFASPSGTVTFYANSVQIGQATLTRVDDVSANATINVQFVVGPNFVEATYSGDAHYLGSTGSFGVTVEAYGNAGVISVVSGTPQSAATLTPFAAPLVVQVTDLYNNPVPGAAVTFTPPSSGASATLAVTGGTPAPVAGGGGKGGQAQVTVSGLTDKNGQLTVQATANGIAGSYPVIATMSNVSANFTLTNVTGNAQGFGAVPVGSSSSTTLWYSLPAGTQSFAAYYGLEFSAGTPSCTGDSSLTCTVPITFQPKYPGVRTDAIVVTDGSGDVLQTTLLSGIGVGSAVAFTPGIINTVAGGGTGGDGGPATSAALSAPTSIVVDIGGNFYLTDVKMMNVRKVDAITGLISTVAGAGAGGGKSGSGKPAPIAGGPQSYQSVKVDGGGNLYLVDSGNNAIRKLDGSTGATTAFAGNGSPGYRSSDDGGPATSAELYNPRGLAVDGAGNVFIADTTNQRIRKVDGSTGLISTVAGNGKTGSIGDTGLAIDAELSYPNAVAVDSAGNLYIADSGNNRIRKVDAVTGIISTVAGNGTADYSGDGGLATSAALNNPSDVVVDSAGDFYIVDAGNHLIRKVDASGIITTVAGVYNCCDPSTGWPIGGFSGDTGQATSAALNSPSGVALDNAGSLYIADTLNSRIRKVDVSTSAISFGTLNIGLTSSPQTVVVSDAGNAPLNFSQSNAFNISSNFQLLNNNCTSQTPLGVGGTCTFGVAFAPTAVGDPLTGTLTVTDDALSAPQAYNATQTVQLSGIATATPPVFTPATLPNVVVEATGPSSTVVTFSVTASNQEGPATVVCTPTSGSTFPLGPTQVSCTATDPLSTSLTSTASFIVSVHDTTPPTLHLPTPINIVSTGINGATVTYTATATDLADPNPTVVCTPASGALFPIGTTTVSCTATDHPVTDSIAGDSGNNHATGTFTVTVRGTPAITWAAPAPITYGTPLSTAQLNAKANVGGTYVYTPTIGAVLIAGNQTLSVTFTPADATDYMTVAAKVTLQVKPATPVLAWAPASIQLGYSLGAGQLDAAASIPGTFTYTPPAGTTIMTTSQTLSVLFTPTDGTDYTTASMSVPLTVTPGPLASVSPSSINFGTVYLGTITVKSVTVTNRGNAPMTISDPFLSIVSGGNSNEFVMANLCPKPLAAGKSCTIAVSFIAGPFYNPQTAIIKVIDNAPGSPQTVSLTATVINPQANFKPTSLSFGTQTVNSSTTKTVTLTNTGATALSITNIAITGTSAADFTQSSACPSSLAAGASCTISVTFKPVSKSTFSAGLTVTDNASSGKQTISLTGTGH